MSMTIIPSATSAPTTASTSTSTAAPATATTWEPFRVLLQEQREDCVQQRELALAEIAGADPDPVVVSRAASLLHTIEEINAALDRIAAGTYGVCVHCAASIPTERLEFRPYAAGCVSCQSTR